MASNSLVVRLRESCLRAIRVSNRDLVTVYEVATARSAETIIIICSSICDYLSAIPEILDSVETGTLNSTIAKQLDCI